MIEQDLLNGNLPRTTESGCKAMDEWHIKTRRVIPQRYGCKPVVRGLSEILLKIQNELSLVVMSTDLLP